MAKEPHDSASEGDGLHTDISVVPVNRVNFSGAGGPSGQDEVHIAKNDANDQVGSIAYPKPTVGDLSAAFHRYGLYQRNDGSGTYSSLQVYFDGFASG